MLYYLYSNNSYYNSFNIIFQHEFSKFVSWYHDGMFTLVLYIKYVWTNISVYWLNIRS